MIELKVGLRVSENKFLYQDHVYEIMRIDKKVVFLGRAGFGYSPIFPTLFADRDYMQKMFDCQDWVVLPTKDMRNCLVIFPEKT